MNERELERDLLQSPSIELSSQDAPRSEERGSRVETKLDKRIRQIPTTCTRQLPPQIKDLRDRPEEHLKRAGGRAAWLRRGGWRTAALCGMMGISSALASDQAVDQAVGQANGGATLGTGSTAAGTGSTAAGTGSTAAGTGSTASSVLAPSLVIPETKSNLSSGSAKRMSGTLLLTPAAAGRQRKAVPVVWKMADGTLRTVWQVPMEAGAGAGTALISAAGADGRLHFGGGLPRQGSSMQVAGSGNLLAAMPATRPADGSATQGQPAPMPAGVGASPQQLLEMALAAKPAAPKPAVPTQAATSVAAPTQPAPTQPAPTQPAPSAAPGVNLLGASAAPKPSGMKKIWSASDPAKPADQQAQQGAAPTQAAPTQAAPTQAAPTQAAPTQAGAGSTVKATPGFGVRGATLVVPNLTSLPAQLQAPAAVAAKEPATPVAATPASPTPASPTPASPTPANAAPDDSAGAPATAAGEDNQQRKTAGHTNLPAAATPPAGTQAAAPAVGKNDAGKNDAGPTAAKAPAVATPPRAAAPVARAAAPKAPATSAPTPAATPTPAAATQVVAAPLMEAAPADPSSSCLALSWPAPAAGWNVSSSGLRWYADAAATLSALESSMGPAGTDRGGIKVWATMQGEQVIATAVAAAPAGGLCLRQFTLSKAAAK